MGSPSGASMQQDLEALADWGQLSVDVLDAIVEVVKRSWTQASIRWLLQSARLVNSHWGRWATGAVTSVQAVVATCDFHNLNAACVARKFSGVRSLAIASKNVNDVWAVMDVGDSGLINMVKHYWFALQLLAKLEQLTSLDVMNFPIPERSLLAKAGKLKHLSRLRLDQCGPLASDNLVRLCSTTSLTNLTVNSVKMRPDVLECLTKVTSITCLDVRFCDLSNDQLAVLATMTLLKQLQLSGEMSDDGLACIGHLKRLTHLGMAPSHLISHDGFKHMQRLPALNGLDLFPAHVRHLGHARDFSFNWVTQMAHLTRLGLRGFDYTKNASLTILDDLPHLRHLDITSCELKRDGLAPVGNLTCLRHLNVSRIFGPPHRHKAEYISRLSHLEVLAVSGDACFDDGWLECLGKLPMLTKLDFNRCCGITDEVLGRLESLTGLRHIEVSNCSRVTTTGVQRLRDAPRIPGCVVEG
ncbi:unnamed protein product [Ostreobium quekettii]|uniref:Disease resistance R13L4/SHOC-2-like LRR domain-containing protein n=1 Tax=Ostreobium quekettii TaxID=121088 RepID=A0A8S1JHK9_9CHLO|nr:unnamed protein product [Ostreobium quekettii]|eukprot:evm.model.scf_1167.2 EVM.evm.TU.scf_1167.2   scf_1167:35753-38728(-)